MRQPIVHVMHILTDTNIGGAGTLLCNQLRAFDKERFCFTVVLPRGSRLAERLRALPCQLLLTEHGADRSAEASAIREYIRIFRTHRPDIVHTHAALSARIAARLCRIPVCIHTRHCVFDLAPWQKNALLAPLSRRVYRAGGRLLSDGVIAVAQAAKKNLTDLGMDEQQIRVIINGVFPLSVPPQSEVNALLHALQLPENAFVVGMVARLEAYKGHKTVLRAAQRCIAADGRFYFLFLGDGSEEQALKREASALGIAQHVRFLGFVDDIAPYYALMQVNVNASYGTETSSLALSEGMSLGIPAVASSFGGNPHMVRSGINGMLFPPHDDAALASILLTLLQDSTLRERLSRGARTFFEENLTAHVMTAQMEAYYLELLQKKRGKKMRKKTAAL